MLTRLLDTLYIRCATHLSRCDSTRLGAASDYKNILIPASVGKISERALLNCKSLETTEFETDSVLREIGKSVFVGLQFQYIRCATHLSRCDSTRLGAAGDRGIRVSEEHCHFRIR
jgi:hypothetical protein